MTAADTIVGRKKLPASAYLGSPVKTDNVDGEQKLEKANWAKVSDNWWYGGNLGSRALTQKQIDFIFDWCKLNNHRYPPRHVDSLIRDMQEGYF